jgi:hypothetical protein
VADSRSTLLNVSCQRILSYAIIGAGAVAAIPTLPRQVYRTKSNEEAQSGSQKAGASWRSAKILAAGDFCSLDANIPRRFERIGVRKKGDALPPIGSVHGLSLPAFKLVVRRKARGNLEVATEHSNRPHPHGKVGNRLLKNELQTAKGVELSYSGWKSPNFATRIMVVLTFCGPSR